MTMPVSTVKPTIPPTSHAAIVADAAQLCGRLRTSLLLLDMLAYALPTWRRPR